VKGFPVIRFDLAPRATDARQKAANPEAGY